MTGTTFDFSADVDDLDGGEYEVRVWSSTDASKVTSNFPLPTLHFAL
jgi:hypothetical protein